MIFWGQWGYWAWMFLKHFSHSLLRTFLSRWLISLITLLPISFSACRLEVMKTILLTPPSALLECLCKQKRLFCNRSQEGMEANGCNSEKLRGQGARLRSLRYNLAKKFIQDFPELYRKPLERTFWPNLTVTFMFQWISS